MNILKELRAAEDAASAAKSALGGGSLKPNYDLAVDRLVKAVGHYGIVITALMTEVAELQKRTNS